MARQNEQELRVVGLGGRDGADEGRDFVSRHDLTFQNLFDEDAESWSVMGISGQPAAILYTADGVEVTRWFGPVAADEVEEALDAAA